MIFSSPLVAARLAHTRNSYAAYLGAAYYPEAWPPEQVDEDIRLMLDAGLNVVRVAEFAWSSMESEEGRFELDWLRRVVDKLGAAGQESALLEHGNVDVLERRRHGQRIPGTGVLSGQFLASDRTRRRG